MTVGLHVTEESVEGKKVLRLAGRLDAASSPMLENRLNHLIEDSQHLILMDFSKVDYLSSAGMRLLLSATKKLKSHNGSLIFFSMHEEVMEIIKMAGFERILHIYKDEREALKAL